MREVVRPAIEDANPIKKTPLFFETHMPLSDLPSLSQTIAQHGLRTRKALGQHFLCDMNLIRKIVAQAGDLTGCTVFEVGSGPGGLTRALVESSAASVIAIEKDSRCVQALEALSAVAQERLRVIEGDALRLNLRDLSTAPRAVVANLPYNVGTELLLGWLHEMEAWQSLTLMFQAEVADRICAAPHGKDYGRLSVLAQFCAVPKRVMEIPSGAFLPPPKVDSAVVHLVPRMDRPRDVPLAHLEKITAAAFGQRRKMLRSSLKPLGGQALLEKAGIDPTLRPENLSRTDFENLARCWGGKGAL